MFKRLPVHPVGESGRGGKIMRDTFPVKLAGELIARNQIPL